MLNDRLKEIRKRVGITQAEFARTIGIASNTVSQIENGQRNPGGAVIKSICREFGVNETWLRTGEGDMFAPLKADEEIAEFMAEVLQDDDDAFRRRFVSMLARLDAQDWADLTRIAQKMIDGREE